MVAQPTFMLITDNVQASLPLPDVVAAALSGGCRRVLYRAPDMPDQEYLEVGKLLRDACSEYGAQFFLSARTHLVRELQADGLHLTAKQSVKDERRVVGNILIGQSCHNETEINRAITEGADYITLSPIFVSDSKPFYGPAMGLKQLHEMSATCPLPVYALGGITPEFAGECVRAGAYGVASMGAVMRSSRPAQLVADFIASCVIESDQLARRT